eukprot:4334109-Pleurochrysis_carterae.AAC.1
MLKNFVTDTGDSCDCRASIPKSELNSAPPSSLSAIQVLTSIESGGLMVMCPPLLRRAPLSTHVQHLLHVSILLSSSSLIVR